MSYYVAPIAFSDRRGQSAVDTLLLSSGIKRDAHLDYTCGVFDEENDTLCATGSCFGATLRCLAVSNAHQGEGLMNMVVSHLCEMQAERGNMHLFLYTKPKAASVFSDLGFYEIARVPDKLVFMENRRTGFLDFLDSLTPSDTKKEKTAAVVMNANPFTKGHRFLLEEACHDMDAVHLFVLSENDGPIPARVRKKLVEEGIRDLPKIILHDSGPYIISSATFPAYFLKDSDSAAEVQAQLDLRVFAKICDKLHIGTRFVGEEKSSAVTALYNRVMQAELPKYGIACREIPRLCENARAVSASTVRQAIHDGRLDAVREMLPKGTWDFLHTPEGEKVIEAIKARENNIHH